MSSLRENYFNVPTEAWPKTRLDTRYRCNLIIPKIFYNDTITLIAKGIKNRFVCEVNEDDGKCKIVATVANDFLPPADLRESASVLPDMLRTKALMWMPNYRLLWALCVEFHGVWTMLWGMRDIVVDGVKTIDSSNNWHVELLLAPRGFYLIMTENRFVFE